MSNVQFAAFRELAYAANLTRYFRTGDVTLDSQATESFRQITQRTAGTYSKMQGYITANANTGTTVFRFRVNAANGNQTFSVASGVTGEVIDNVNADVVAAGDETTIQMVTGTTGGSITPVWVGGVFSANSNTVKKLATSRVEVTAASSTLYFPIEGSQGPNATEAGQEVQMKVAGTLRNLFFNAQVSSRSTDTTFRIRKNGANGNQSLVITAGVSGLYEDNVNTDAVAIGDLINFSLTTGTGTGTVSETVAVDFETTNNTSINMSTYLTSSNTQATSVTNNGCLFARIDSGTGISEAEAQVDAQFSQTLYEMQCYVISNGITANTTLRLRKNGANGNQVITIASGVTGRISDSVNKDSFVLNDEFNYQLITGGTGTTILFSYYALFCDASGELVSVLPPIQQPYLDKKFVTDY